MNKKYNWESMFENSIINFTVYTEPVSLQNREVKKRELKKKFMKLQKLVHI